MRVMTGTVVAGKVVLKESIVADGTDVWVVMPDACAQNGLAAAELAEIEAGIAEADAGQMVDGNEWLARLRHRSGR